MVKTGTEKKDGKANEQARKRANATQVAWFGVAFNLGVAAAAASSLIGGAEASIDGRKSATRGAAAAAVRFFDDEGNADTLPAETW